MKRSLRRELYQPARKIAEQELRKSNPLQEGGLTETSWLAPGVSMSNRVSPFLCEGHKPNSPARVACDLRGVFGRRFTRPSCRMNEISSKTHTRSGDWSRVKQKHSRDPVVSRGPENSGFTLSLQGDHSGGLCAPGVYLYTPPEWCGWSYLQNLCSGVSVQFSLARNPPRNAPIVVTTLLKGWSA